MGRLNKLMIAIALVMVVLQIYEIFVMVRTARKA